MFISRKKYEEAIANAKMQVANETEEKIWQRERMSRFEEDVRIRLADFEKRICGKEAERIDLVCNCTSSQTNLNSVADAAVNILSSVLKKLIDNKGKFCLTDEDKEVIKAKELLKKMGCDVNE